MIRRKPHFAWMLSVTVVLISGVALAQHSSESTPSKEDGWRRTVDGWEQWPHASPVFAHSAVLATSPRMQSVPFPGAAHPAAWAGLQLSLSLLALGVFPSKDA